MKDYTTALRLADSSFLKSQVIRIIGLTDESTDMITRVETLFKNHESKLFNPTKDEL